MREIDAVRGKKNQNLLSAKLQNALMAEVVAGKFDLVVASPPCSTFSRARSASVSGPAAAAIAAASTWLSEALEVGTCSSGFVESAGGLHDQAARSASGKRSQAHGSLGAPRRFGPTPERCCASFDLAMAGSAGIGGKDGRLLRGLVPMR